MFKKIFYLLIIALLVASCGETYDSVNRGLTGAKSKSADEFLIKKKDPLILPPDYENLPSPDNTIVENDEISSFEKKLEDAIETETSSSGSIEDSILKKIQSK